MNNKELIAHFKERTDDMDKTMSLLQNPEIPTSAVTRVLCSIVVRLLCAISYDIALMAQHQLEQEGNT